jgi:hypothetical protein
MAMVSSGAASADIASVYSPALFGAVLSCGIPSGRAMGGGSVAGFLETAEDVSGVNRKGAGAFDEDAGGGNRRSRIVREPQHSFISCLLEPFQVYGEFQ